jgi:hypothetical protein
MELINEDIHFLSILAAITWNSLLGHGNAMIVFAVLQNLKKNGMYGKYLIPIHAGAAVSHSFQAHVIFFRISLFGHPK